MSSVSLPRSYADLTRVVASPSRAAWLVGLAALCVVLPYLANSYVLGFATLIVIMAVGAIGLQVLIGWTGLVSLGFAGFLALGAYANAYFMDALGLSLVLSIPLAGLVSGLASLLVGVPSLRLRGLYLAITTLAFSVIVSHVIQLAEPITGGSSGLSVSRPTLFGLKLTSDTAIFHLSAVVLALAIFVAVNIRRSYLGRAFFAIRDYEVAARVLGVNVVAYKLLSFALSSAFVGVAGALFGLHLRYLNVESFELLLSIEAVSIIIVGGLGSIAGAVLGSIFMVLLPELARIGFSLAQSSVLGSILSSNVQEIRGAIYGLTIILCLRFAPKGLAGMIRQGARRLRRWPLPY